LADAYQHRPAHHAVSDLLVERQRPPDRLTAHRAQLHGEPGAGDQRVLAVDGLSVDQAEPLRQAGFERHADRNRLPVGESPEARGGLDRVADGMPVVENLALTALPFVRLHDPCFERRAAGDDFDQGLRIETQHRPKMLLEKFEEVGIADHGRLDHLGDPAAEFPLRQRGQETHVGNDR